MQAKIYIKKSSIARLQVELESLEPGGWTIASGMWNNMHQNPQ